MKTMPDRKQEGMKKERLYDIVIKTFPVGFLRVDDEGIIVDFNLAAEEITGYLKEEVVGRSRFEVLHCTLEKEVCPLYKYTLRRQEHTIAKENFIRRKTGECIALSVTTAPLFDDRGNLMGGVELFMDITEFKRLDRERKNILSMFAHDMKNPIITAGGFSQRLLSGKAGPSTAKQRDYLRLIREELNKLESLVADFLEFSHFEATGCRPITAPVDIKTLLCKYVETAGIKAEERKIVLTCMCPDKSAIVALADARLIGRVIANLLDNAIRYINPGGSVTIKVSRKDDAVLVRVEDTGFGISEDHIPYIFDAFYRVSRGLTGSGLGLSIAKTIVEAHGGRMWVESVHGQGSVFNFTLPVS